MNRQPIWLAMSYAWTEIGLEPNEYPEFAAKIDATKRELRAFDREALGVVCGAFGVSALLALATMGMSMPDWGYNDEYVLNKVQRWRDRPLIVSLLNPVWLLGYAVACILALGVWWKLRKAVVAAAARNDNVTLSNETSV